MCRPAFYRNFANCFQQKACCCAGETKLESSTTEHRDSESRKPLIGFRRRQSKDNDDDDDDEEYDRCPAISTTASAMTVPGDDSNSPDLPVPSPINADSPVRSEENPRSGNQGVSSPKDSADMPNDVERADSDQSLDEGQQHQTITASNACFDEEDPAEDADDEISDAAAGLQNNMAQVRKKHKLKGRAGSEGGPASQSRSAASSSSASSSSSTSTSTPSRKGKGTATPTTCGEESTAGDTNEAEYHEHRRNGRPLINQEEGGPEDSDDSEELDDCEDLSLAGIYLMEKREELLQRARGRWIARNSVASGERSNWQNDGPANGPVNWDSPASDHANEDGAPGPSSTSETQPDERHRLAPKDTSEARDQYKSLVQSQIYPKAAKQEPTHIDGRKIIKKAVGFQEPGAKPTTTSGLPIEGIGAEDVLTNIPRRPSLVGQEVSPDEVILRESQGDQARARDQDIRTRRSTQQEEDSMSEVKHAEEADSEHAEDMSIGHAENKSTEHVEDTSDELKDDINSMPELERHPSWRAKGDRHEKL